MSYSAPQIWILPFSIQYIGPLKYALPMIYGAYQKCSLRHGTEKVLVIKEAAYESLIFIYGFLFVLIAFN